MAPEVTSGLVAVTTPSTRCGSGVVNTSSVGMFGAWTIPSIVLKRAADHSALRQQADRQVGTRTLEPQRV